MMPIMVKNIQQHILLFFSSVSDFQWASSRTHQSTILLDDGLSRYLDLNKTLRYKIDCYVFRIVNITHHWQCSIIQMILEVVVLTNTLIMVVGNNHILNKVDRVAPLHPPGSPVSNSWNRKLISSHSIFKSWFLIILQFLHNFWIQ